MTTRSHRIALFSMAGASAALALALLCVAACSEPSQSHRVDPRQELLDSWASDLILPQYAEFTKGAKVLEERVASLCDEPSADTLRAAKDAWWKLRQPWKQNEIIKFGPYRDLPAPFGPMLNFWPTRPDVVQSVLDADEPLDVDSLAAFGSPARGMPAVEMLLYVGGAPEDVFDPSGRRCEYLLVASEDLHLVAAAFEDAWDPDGGNYVSELTDPKNGVTFQDLRAAVSEVVNRLAFTLEDMRGDKLGRPLGEQSGGEPQPDLIESRPSARSIQDLLDNLRGIELFYFGAEEPESAVGVSDFAPDRFNEEMTTRLANCRLALEGIDPLEQAIAENADGVVAAEECLSELQTFIQVDLVNELGLTVNINDTDGD